MPYFQSHKLRVAFQRRHNAPIPIILTAERDSLRFWEIIGNTQKPVSKKLTPVDLEKPAGLPETVFDFTEVR